MMKSLTLLSAIASGYLMTLGTPAYGQDLSLPPIEEPSLAPLPADLSPINTETDGENSFLEALSNEPSPFETVGLRINESRIVTAFHGSLIRYVGDCPGTHWSGNATRDNVRFISHTVPPSKNLRVSLINLTSGESITKDYAKEGVFERRTASGQLVEIANYRNDTLHGERILFYESGDTSSIETYKRGTFSGPYQLFYPDGTIKQAGRYRDNLMVGKWKGYCRSIRHHCRFYVEAGPE